MRVRDSSLILSSWLDLLQKLTRGFSPSLFVEKKSCPDWVRAEKGSPTGQKHSPSSARGEGDAGRESLSSYFLPQMMSRKGKTQPFGWCGYVLSSPGTKCCDLL